MVVLLAEEVSGASSKSLQKLHQLQRSTPHRSSLKDSSSLQLMSRHQLLYSLAIVIIHIPK